MKILKAVLLVLFVLIAVLMLGGLFVSPQFHVVRSAQIQAAPDKLYPLVANLKAWSQWGAWQQRDPAMQTEYRGPETGVGAVSEWKSKSQGDGRMTIVEAEPGRRVKFELYFPDFGTTSYGELRFEAANGGTQVTWSMDGDMGKNPINRWMGLMMDKMVGPDFETGLKNLKALAEKP
jgi:hypothetical protein